MTKQTRDTLTLKTADALRITTALERAGMLAAAHTTAQDAHEIAECLRLIGGYAQRAADRIDAWTREVRRVE